MTWSNQYGELVKYSKAICPSGWRLPTIKEFEALSAHYSELITFEGVKGRWFSGRNVYSDNVQAVFLPNEGDGIDFGHYWSSSIKYNDNFSYLGNCYLLSYKYGVSVDNYSKNGSMLVRCVKE